MFRYHKHSLAKFPRLVVKKNQISMITRVITPKRETKDGIHLRGLATGRVAGHNASDLTGPGMEPRIYPTVSGVFNHYASEQIRRVGRQVDEFSKSKCDKRNCDATAKVLFDNI